MVGVSKGSNQHSLKHRKLELAWAGLDQVGMSKDLNLDSLGHKSLDPKPLQG